MKLKLLFLLAGTMFLMNSCIEIIDDISLNNDGSGSLKYIVNLNSSKVKINSILALDSLDGKKVPSLYEIEQKIDDFGLLLEQQDGISKVALQKNMNDYIFKLQCEFKHIDQLQNAIKSVIKEISKEKEAKEFEHNWLSINEQKITRSIPDFGDKLSRHLKDEDAQLLKEGSYTSITRFATPIALCSNKNATLSPSKKAVMLKANTYALAENPKILENTVELEPEK